MRTLYYSNGDGGRVWRAIRNEQVEFYFVGASVTAQRGGWADRFVELLTASSGKTYSIEKNAMGGVGVLFGVANYPSNPAHRRIVFIEFSSGDLNFGLTPVDRLRFLLERLLRRTLSDNSLVIIVHNWRADCEIDDHHGIRRIYDEVAREYRIPVIANHRFVAAQIVQDSSLRSRWFRDVCHTTVEGATEYALHMLSCLKEMSESEQTLPPRAELEPNGDESHLDFCIPSSESGDWCGRPISTYVYPNTQQAFKYTEVALCDELSFVASGQLFGVGFISGPTAGWVSLSIDGVELRKFRCFDRHSYYERYILLPTFAELEHSRLVLKCVDLDVDFSMAAQAHLDFQSPRSMKLVHLAGRGLRVHS